VEQPEYTAETAEAAVKAGEVPVALIVPHGFGENAISLPVADTAAERQQRHDCAALVTGLLQKVAMTSMPDVMAELGSKYMDQYAGGFTSEQRKRMDASLDQLRKQSAAASSGMLISVTATDVVGENKHNPMVSLNAAAIGVMFLLFTASGASGSLLDEPESDTLDRVLSSRVTMGTQLAGKMLYSGLLAGNIREACRWGML
jgi:ABC-2 type transport system permease protein